MTFSPAQARQLATVLRLHTGDIVSVFDGTGREWTAELILATPARALARLHEPHPPEAAPAVRLTLAQVVPRGAAMDFIVGKATELGVTRIIPLETVRSVRRASLTGQASRWRRIVGEATEQCGRRRPADLAEPCTLDEFVRAHPGEQPLLVCDNGADAIPLADACRTLMSARELTVLVGGEGGLSADEVESARSAGGRLVALGPRLLRADTAALAALAVLQSCLGDWTQSARM